MNYLCKIIVTSCEQHGIQIHRFLKGEFMAAAIEADVRSILPPIREGKIDRAYTNAWNDWWKSQDRPRLSRWDRTRANNIFEYLTTHLMDEFADDSGARFIFGRETFKLILIINWLLALKKPVPMEWDRI